MTKIVSIDLETLDVTTTAVILEIGIVVGDDQGNVIEQFRMYPDIQEQLAANRSVSGDTFLWWLEQDEIARCNQTGQSRKSKDEVAREYLSFITPHIDRDTRVLGNAPSFDCEILSDYIGTKPWNFWQERDVRTAREIIPRSMRCVNTEAHNALADAATQYNDYITFLGLRP